MPTPPILLVDDRLTLDVGGATMQVVFPGAAHSADNVVVRFDDRGVQYGGCAGKSGTSLGYLGHADVASWRDAIEVVLALKPRLVIPGHGDSTGPEIVGHTADLVRSYLAGQK